MISPASTLTDAPWKSPGVAVSFDRQDIEYYKYSLTHEGYFVTEPCIPVDRLDMLTNCISDVMSVGHRPGYALIYDEFFHVLAGLETLLAGILGENFLMVPDEPELYFIPTSNQCGGSGPHRDTLRFPDMYDQAGMPQLINIWIAITDCTEINSCIYVIPAHQDLDYRTERSLNDLPPMVNIDLLQKSRALPVKAGSVVGWSTELIHWGGQSSDTADLPRLSGAMYFQSGDCRKFHPSASKPHHILPFPYRLYMVEKVLSDPDGGKLGNFLLPEC